MFAPTEFLRIAEELKAASSDKAKLRTSISRAYYCAFLFSREWLKSRGVKFPDSGEAHGIAQKELHKHVNRSTRDLLSSLRRNRNDADYELTKTIDQNEANNAIDIARQILANIAAKS